MDNPYWTSEGQTHHINLKDIRSLCFDIVSLFEASKSLADEMTASEYADEKPAGLEDFPLAKLHMEMSFKKSSVLLLQLALMVRTYDDQVSDMENNDDFSIFKAKCDDNSDVGVLDTGVLNIREACNKLIHAKEIRPLYERTDKYVIDSTNESFDGDIWYLTGEIELSGSFRRNEWNAVLYVQPFLEAIIELTSYGYPEINIEQ